MYYLNIEGEGGAFQLHFLLQPQKLNQSNLRICFPHTVNNLNLGKVNLILVTQIHYYNLVSAKKCDPLLCRFY